MALRRISDAPIGGLARKKGGSVMTKSNSIGTSAHSEVHFQTVAPRVQELAEAGAKGRALTPAEVRTVCEALRAQGARARNQFHSGV